MKIDPVRIDTMSDYVAALDSWAAVTLSRPEPSWKGPGMYCFGGYVDDENRPVATLEMNMVHD